MIITFSPTFVLEMSAQFSLKVAAKGSFRDKKTLKNWYFWYYLPKAETVQCFQNNLSISCKFETFIPYSALYFLEVSARL